MTLYLDWGIITHMKQGHLDDFKHLLNKLNNSKIFYSTSHISDLFVSYDGSEEHQNWINDDLQYLSDITNGYCAYIENGEVVINKYDPFELFDQRIQEHATHQTGNWFENTLKTLEPGVKGYDEFLKMKTTPMPQEIIDALNNSNTPEFHRRWYSGLTPDSTLADLVSVGMARYRNMMQGEGYKELRDMMREHLKIGEEPINWSDPFKEIENLHQHGDHNQIMRPDSKHSPKWFQEISNSYLMLDMHGFKKDNIDISGKRKETMRNTVDDGFHAAFASLCDIYVTNDKRALFKTKEVYKKLDIKTQVFNTNEFIELHKMEKQPANEGSEAFQIDLSLLDKAKQIIEYVKKLDDDQSKINEIVTYIENTNTLLLLYGTAINSSLKNQQLALEGLNLNLKSINLLSERITNLETSFEAQSSHLETYDQSLDLLAQGLDAHNQHLTAHDTHLDALDRLT